MENKRFLTAQNVMEMLDVSLSYAYKLIRQLNAELEVEGFASEGKGVWVYEAVCDWWDKFAGEVFGMDLREGKECEKRKEVACIVHVTSKL